MDSQSVIGTFNECHYMSESGWVTQRDSDVWRELIGENKMEKEPNKVISCGNHT